MILERFSIQFRKTKAEPVAYILIRLLSQSQTVVKPKSKQRSIENRSNTLIFG